MRVIAGKYRGKNLIAPKDNSIRPTTDRIKEDLFNILMPYIPESLFWDMFSGSGSVGIEAVSRGAKSALLTDNSIKSINLIKANVEKVGIKDEIIIRKTSVEKYIFENKEKFDIIFADPPYKYEGLKDLIRLIDKSDILNDDGVFILEHDKNIEFADEMCNLQKFKTKTYSLTQLDFFKLKER